MELDKLDHQTERTLVGKLVKYEKVCSVVEVLYQMFTFLSLRNEPSLNMMSTLGGSGFANLSLLCSLSKN